MIRRIGLTGGIASGKSRVAAILCSKLDCVLIDADAVCRRLLEPGAAGWQEFSRIFGTRYLAEDGSIDRSRLRRDLFADDAFRQEVNNIIHPLAKKVIKEKMERILDSDDNSRVIVEVPLLYEVRWENLFDTVVVVYADDETCLKRLMERDGMERNMALRELQSQLPLAEKKLRAEHVIDNSGLLPDTLGQVERLAELLGGSSE